MTNGKRGEAQDHERSGVDPAALSLGGVGAAIALVTSEGAWSLTSSLVGLALLLVLVGYHHREPDSVKGWLLSAAYSLIASLLMTLVAAYFVQSYLPFALVNQAFQWVGAQWPDCDYFRSPLDCQRFTEDLIAGVILDVSVRVAPVAALLIFIWDRWGGQIQQRIRRLYSSLEATEELKSDDADVSAVEPTASRPQGRATVNTDSREAHSSAAAEIVQDSELPNHDGVPCQARLDGTLRSCATPE